MRSSWFIAPAALLASTSGYAATYLTVVQAQTALFPGTTLVPAPCTLTAAEVAAIEQTSGVRVRVRALRTWRSPDGSWFIVDEVIGKHEFITYACKIDAAGTLAGLEIMDYRESYGGEVRNAKWRRQFTGKTAASPLKLDQDIQNISGATLSSRHLTEGVKRLLVTHEIALKNRR